MIPKIISVRRYVHANSVSHMLTICKQASVGGDAKIPTVIYCDQDGEPQALGAQTVGTLRQSLQALIIPETFS